MTSNPSSVNLMVTSDSGYVPLVAALLASVHQHLPEDQSLEVHWLHVDDNQGPRQQLARFCERDLPRCKLHIWTFDTLPSDVKAQVESLIGENASSWGPALCFAAPFILPLILPPSVRRAVFVDADVIALGDISELMTVSLDDLPAGAVRAPLKMFDKRLGLQRYSNSGVVVMDLEPWRNEGVSQRAIDYLHKISGAWGENFPDQDALNVTLADSNGQPRWKELDPKWNACSALFTHPSWRLLYKKLPISQVKLLHYCGAKPWGRVPATLLGKIARRKGFQFGPTKAAHPHGDLFFKILEKTPFKAP